MREWKKPVSITMPPSLALELRIQAAIRNKSRSALICEFAVLGLERLKAQEGRAGSE